MDTHRGQRAGTSFDVHCISFPGARDSFPIPSRWEYMPRLTAASAVAASAS